MPTGICDRTKKASHLCRVCGKDIKRKRISGMCLGCLNKSEEHRKKLKENHVGMLGKHHSEETKKKLAQVQKLERGSNWKGDAVGYNALHDWLRKNFGNSNKCENERCDKKSKKYDWCLIVGKKYERKRENFTMRCRKCHCEMDKQNN